MEVTPLSVGSVLKPRSVFILFFSNERWQPRTLKKKQGVSADAWDFKNSYYKYVKGHKEYI